MPGLTIACVLRSGGDYRPEWVHALKRGLSRHMSLPYRSPMHELEPGTWTFRCLSDVDLGRHSIPLIHDWPGWWAKVELFRPELFDGLVLYLDLDTLVVDDLSQLAEYAGSLAVLSDFYQPRIMASGAMLFRPGHHTEAIYNRFRSDPEGVMASHRSRSDHWYATVMESPDRLQDVFPGSFVSFKAHARHGAPEGARAVCFHGKPRPNDPAAGWGYDEWRSLKREAA